MHYKTGLLRAPHPPELRFVFYLKTAQVPPVPAVFGHYGLFTRDGWGMLDNDRLGCCTVSGADHAIMLFNKMAGKTVEFTNLDVQDDYFTITGGDDAGADMVTVAKYWRNVGFRDSKNIRHKITAYLAVDETHLDLERVYAAAYLFGAVGLGVQIPSSAERQFIDRKPWANVSGDVIEGYHYVPLVGRAANGNAVVVTWGAAQEVEQSWLAQNLRECVAMISPEVLTSGKSLEGFDLTALEEDLESIGIA